MGSLLNVSLRQTHTHTHTSYNTQSTRHPFTCWSGVQSIRVQVDFPAVHVLAFAVHSRAELHAHQVDRDGRGQHQQVRDGLAEHA